MMHRGNKGTQAGSSPAASFPRAGDSPQLLLELEV